MTIDERLQALTESLELMAAMQRDNERRNQQQFAETGQLFGQIALRLREVTDRVREVTAGLDTLSRIAGVHQDRLDGHEKRLDDLEQGPRS